MTSQQIRKIAFIGTYVPRQCGIATFTNDLYQSMAAGFPDKQFMVLAMTDQERAYRYPEEARLEIYEESFESYRKAADFLNINNVDIVSLQHEFGIFGGIGGSHILGLLRELRMPVVTTLHTVFRKPKEIHKRIIHEIAEISDRVITMAEKGREFLIDIYKVPDQKIEVIPHGIHDMPFIDPNYFKDQFGVQGKTVLLSFGLIGKNKGLEYVIDALPRILEKHPQLVFIVLGATHPHELQVDGENYRLSLERLAKRRGVEQNVIFYNRYVTLDELKEFIGAADLYVTPYLDEDQITSGTLAYTVGAGKAVLSTPYFYAQELLADDRGVIVPFAKSEPLADAILNLLSDDARRHAMRKRAYTAGREMIWPRVAERYMEAFRNVWTGLPAEMPSRAFGEGTLEKMPVQLPPLKLDHLFTLTDRTGILHRATYNVPDYNGGYKTDDNALGFVLATLLNEIGQAPADRLQQLASTYLAFLSFAFDSSTGRFRDQLGYDRRWRDDVASDDTQARAVWALGTAIGRSQRFAFRAIAEQLLERTLPSIRCYHSPRAWAHALVGLHEYLQQFKGDRAASALRDELTEKLFDCYRRNQAPEWNWFEEELTYENARLSHALILSGRWTQRADVMQAGLDTLRWLMQQQSSPSDCFSPVGDQGYFRRGGERARFNQIPNDTYVTIAACMEAFRVTGDMFWYQEARRALDWFFGRNDLNVPLYDTRSGGCRDGLGAQHAAPDEGATSSLAFYLSWVELRLGESMLSVGQDVLQAAN